MITNHLLEAKYKVQKQLNEDARHDIAEYAMNSHRIVEETEAKYKIKFKYASVNKDCENLSADNKHA